jgi:hypothetical protein
VSDELLKVLHGQKLRGHESHQGQPHADQDPIMAFL